LAAVESAALGFGASRSGVVTPATSGIVTLSPATLGVGLLALAISGSAILGPAALGSATIQFLKGLCNLRRKL
jgi:hypothetical protein